MAAILAFIAAILVNSASLKPVSGLTSSSLTESLASTAVVLVSGIAFSIWTKLAHSSTFPKLASNVSTGDPVAPTSIEISGSSTTLIAPTPTAHHPEHIFNVDLSVCTFAGWDDQFIDVCIGLCKMTSPGDSKVSVLRVDSIISMAEKVLDLSQQNRVQVDQLFDHFFNAYPRLLNSVRGHDLAIAAAARFEEASLNCSRTLRPLSDHLALRLQHMSGHSPVSVKARAVHDLLRTRVVSDEKQQGDLARLRALLIQSRTSLIQGREMLADQAMRFPARSNATSNTGDASYGHSKASFAGRY